MFSEDNQSNIQKDQDITYLEKGSELSTKQKDILSLHETEGTGTEAINLGKLVKIVVMTSIMMTPSLLLLDKDWDEEIAKLRRSPNDKAAHFDIASYNPGNEGGKPKEKDYTHCSNIHKQLPFTLARSLEECIRPFRNTQRRDMHHIQGRHKHPPNLWTTKD
ncbi:hypothetical protein Salat_0473200 [Sesamum alatum]|uniref:Uncharacterized protein n=1 Tax=Sesamum alatum TaxID=300844 RepID=A0AAE1Z4K5_9LAMI|nr:hypothetical protein Salat_0473200 [Sesamum alatum]